MLVDEAVEAGAAWPAVEPEDEGVLCRVALRLHQVVEEPPPVRLVHRHVPGVVLGGEVGAMEAGDAGDEVLLGRGGGGRAEERGHGDDEEEQEEERRRGHWFGGDG